MPTADDLAAAVTHGIIDAEQAEKLGSFLATRSAGDPWEPSAEDRRSSEDVRFVRGFHDIFIAVGIILLFFGFAVTSTTVSFHPGIVYFVAAAVAWGLAEHLARIKRLVLPSMVLAIFFTLFVGAAVLSTMEIGPVRFGRMPWGEPGLVAGAVATAAAVLFYRRFRLPFALGAIAGAALFLVVALVHVVAPDFARGYQAEILLVSGLVIFAAAMSYDLSDPERRTLRADNAFWLHLLAAPLLVRSVLSGGILNGGATTSLSDAVVIFAVVAALALVALLIDRRALLVAGLGYLGFAIAAIIRETSVETSTGIAITLVVLGAGVVMLGTGWQKTRHVLFRFVPLPSGFKNRLPPPAGQT